jgi:hypothetical protein
MSRVQYIVVLNHEEWFVIIQSKHHGPYASQKDAIEDAIQAASKLPNAEVLVQQKDNQFRPEWTSGRDPEPDPACG